MGGGGDDHHHHQMFDMSTPWNPMGALSSHTTPSRPFSSVAHSRPLSLPLSLSPFCVISCLSRCTPCDLSWRRWRWALHYLLCHFVFPVSIPQIGLIVIVEPEICGLGLFSSPFSFFLCGITTVERLAGQPICCAHCLAYVYKGAPGVLWLVHRGAQAHFIGGGNVLGHAKGRQGGGPRNAGQSV